MGFPVKYRYLKEPGVPKMIEEAVKTYGIMEYSGEANNPVILQWAKEAKSGLSNLYKSDLVPWCGLWMGVIAKRAGKPVVNDPLWALNWGTFGKFTDAPMLGDVLVFIRKTKKGATAGHVGLYVGESTYTYHVLGGNQSNCVSIMELSKTRLYQARRPLYLNQPPSVKKILIDSTGNISYDEA